MTASSFTERHAVLDMLHRGEGYIDLRALANSGDMKQFSFVAGNHQRVDEFAELHADRNVFFGVALRSNRTGCSAKDCKALNALFADIDYKHTAEADARRVLASFPLLPTAVVNSGGGLHCYWALTEPFIFTDATALAMAKQMLKSLAQAVAGDLDSAEPARILRLPATSNQKYSPARLVTVEELAPNRRYSLDEIVSALPELPSLGNNSSDADLLPVEHDLSVATRQRVAGIYLRSQPPAIQGEGGDAHTFTICCRVALGFDLDADATFEALSEWNEQCVPPWPDEQLRTKVRNAIRYGTEQRGGRLRFVQSDAPFSGYDRRLVRAMGLHL